jgi:predicted RNase H-like nuclease (RuvC/YqgF family)
MGWIKTVGERIGKRLADPPTTASQKLELETKEMLSEAVHKDAIKVLKTELERLTRENQELRATVERLTWENEQAETSISHLEEALHAYHG